MKKKIQKLDELLENIQNDIDEYCNDLENEEDDIFGGTEDALSNERLEQNLFESICAFSEDQSIQDELFNYLLSEITDKNWNINNLVSGINNIVNSSKELDI